MSPRCAGLRALVLLWAALQLALPGVAALADGVSSRTSVHATAHVESSTERACIRVHEADCVFCQFLSVGGTPAGARAARLPAIALSGYGREEDVQRSKEAGFAAHLTKPVNLQHLLSTVASFAS